MATVHLLWHIREVSGEDDEKLIGVYSMKEGATAAVERLRQKPGFKDFPDCFQIFEYVVDQDGWSEGFAYVHI